MTTMQSSSGGRARQQRPIQWRSHAIKCIRARHGPPCVRQCPQRQTGHGVAWQSGQAARLQFRLQCCRKRCAAQGRPLGIIGPKGQTHGSTMMQKDHEKSRGQLSQGRQRSEKRNKREDHRAYWYSHVTSPVEAGGCGRPDAFRICHAMPWYHVTCRHAESQGARSRPASSGGDGKVKTHQTHQRVEWAGQHQAHQRVSGAWRLYEVPGAWGAPPWP